MATQAAQYSRALQQKLSESGLQGSLQADAYKALLQYVSEVQGDLDILYNILEQLRQSELMLSELLRSLAVHQVVMSAPLRNQCHGNVEQSVHIPWASKIDRYDCTYSTSDTCCTSAHGCMNIG